MIFANHMPGVFRQTTRVIPEKSEITADTSIHTSPCRLLIEAPKVRPVAASMSQYSV